MSELVLLLTLVSSLDNRLAAEDQERRDYELAMRLAQVRGDVCGCRQCQLEEMRLLKCFLLVKLS